MIQCKMKRCESVFLAYFDMFFWPADLGEVNTIGIWSRTTTLTLTPSSNASLWSQKSTFELLHQSSHPYTSYCLSINKYLYLSFCCLIDLLSDLVCDLENSPAEMQSPEGFGPPTSVWGKEHKKKKSCQSIQYIKLYCVWYAVKQCYSCYTCVINK